MRSIPHNSAICYSWRLRFVPSSVHTLSGLAAASIATVLLPLKQQLASALLSHVCAHAPLDVRGYIEPSLAVLSLYWRDSCDEVMHSARSIFSARIDRLSGTRKSLYTTHTHTGSTSGYECMSLLFPLTPRP